MTVAGAPPAVRSARRLEVATAGWNTLEAVVAVASGLAAGSVVLTGFGLDSGIEVVSALIVLNRLRTTSLGEVHEERVRRALRAIAVTFFALAVYLTVDGIVSLATASRPDTSRAGIAISAAALVVMPVLARAKGAVGRRIDGPLGALVLADAAETRLCALLAVATLGGLLAYGLAGWRWADPVAGFAIACF
ncbi:MAG: cation diffusion facilitator family transporter, partial [Candidatus Dormibacteria bacterium]